MNRLAVLITLVLLLSACNKTDPNPSSDNIKLMFIGQITDTANATSVAEAAAGVKAAVARINNNGGLLGKPIQLLVCDDKADANEAAKCARKAVREHVLAVVGSNSNHSGVILPILQSAPIPSFGQNPITPQDFSNPISFPLLGGAPTAVKGIAKLLAQQGAKNIRIAAVDSLAGSLAEGFARTALADTDANLKGMTLIPIGAPDYAGYAAALMAGSDGIMIAMNADQAARIIVALRQAGATQAIAVMALALPPTTLAQLGDKAEGLLVASTDRPTQSADRSLYLDDMASYAPGAKLNAFSLRSWLAVTALERILSQMNPAPNDDLSASELLALLGTIENKTVSDLIPPLTTNKPLAAPFNRLFVHHAMYARIVDGKAVLINEQWHSN